MPIAIGALVGGIVGGSLAFSIGASFLTGWAIGSLIGQFLFAPDNNQVFTGPRLENKSPAVSNIVGSPIQITYGVDRVPLSIIWSDNIREKEIRNTTTTKSGSSKSSSTSVTFEYYLDFAVAIGEGPIAGVTKIWANNKLIFDKEGDIIAEPWLDFTLYLGTEDQPVDPTMQAALGITNANRGLAYIVFKNFYLKDYGNRAPFNMEAKVIGSGTNTYPSENIYTDTNWEINSFAEAKGSAIVVVDEGVTSSIYFGTPNITSSFAIKFHKEAPKLGNQLYLSDSFVKSNVHSDTYLNTTLGSHHLVGRNRDGSFVTWHVVTTDIIIGTETTYITLYDDEWNYLTKKTVGIDNSGSFNSYVSIGFIFSTLFLEKNSDVSWTYWRYMDCSDSYGTSQATNAAFTVQVLPTGSSFTGYLVDYELEFSRTNGGYFVGPQQVHYLDEHSTYHYFCATKEDAVNNPNRSWWYYQYSYQDFYNLTDPSDVNLQVTPKFKIDLSDFPGVNLNPPCDDPTKKYNDIDYFGKAFYIYEVSNGIWALLPAFTKGTDTEIPSKWVLYAVFIPNGNTIPTIWHQSSFIVEGAESLANVSNEYAINIGYIDKVNNMYYIYSNYNKIISYNFITGIWLEYTLSPALLIDFNTAKMAYLGFGRFLISGVDGSADDYMVYLVDINSVASNVTYLGPTVKDIANRSGLTNAFLDTTSIDTTILKGYTIRDRETARKSIEDLILPYFVDPVVSDWVLKFVPRGSTTTTIIPYNDLGCTGQEYEEPYSIILPEENNLPKVCDFRYLSPTNEFQTSHQRASRHSKATTTEDKLNINTTVVLSDEYAKEATIKFLENAWINSKRVAIKIPKKYSYLEPTDIIQFFTKENLLVTARIVEIFNDYNILDVGAEMEYFDIYDSIDTGEYAASFNSSTQQKIALISLMIVLPIESYPIYDIFTEAPANTENAYIYLGGTSYFSNWPGGSVYFSQDNVDFVPGEILNNQSKNGLIVSHTKRLDTVGHYSVQDIETSIVVDFTIDPVMSSITKQEALNGGKNLLWIENNGYGELLIAQTVSNVGNTYTFSNLLRGRYGSNIEIDNHPIDSRNRAVVVIDSLTIKPVSMPYGIYDNTYYYKGVTTGSNPTYVPSESKFYTGRWNDTMPATNTSAVLSGSDILVSWEPVSNYPALNNFWPATIESNLHKIEIYNGSNTLLRSQEGLTTFTYTYTSANMTTDSITVNDLIIFKIYRISTMKGYDTTPATVYFYKDISVAFSDVTTSGVALGYLFNEQPSFTDLVGTYSGNLGLGSGVALTKKLPSLIQPDKWKGSYVFTKGNNWVSSSNSVPASDSFSIAMVFKVLHNSATEASTCRFFSRNGTSTYGIHHIDINTTTDTGIHYVNLLTDSGTVVELGQRGDTIFVIHTIKTVAGPTQQFENTYLEGQLINTSTSGTSVSGWNGEFQVGDIALDVNFKSWMEIEVSSLIYWNYELTQAEVINIWNMYKNGGIRL